MENYNDYIERIQERQTYICPICNKSVSVLTSYKFENFFDPKMMRHVRIENVYAPRLDIVCDHCGGKEMKFFDEECAPFYIKLKNKNIDVYSMEGSATAIDSNTSEYDYFTTPYTVIHTDNDKTNKIIEKLQSIKESDDKFKYIAIVKGYETINGTCIFINLDIEAVKKGFNITVLKSPSLDIRTSDNTSFYPIFKELVQSYYDFLNAICDKFNLTDVDLNNEE